MITTLAPSSSTTEEYVVKLWKFSPKFSRELSEQRFDNSSLTLISLSGSNSSVFSVADLGFS